jgi:hypothetical protein
MAKHYMYRMDHDTGFAPHVAEDVCTLCGCKTTTVEAWAEPGSWVIGIGGMGTGRPDALIYALKVEVNPSLAEFQRQSPQRAVYLAGRSLKPTSKVLVARHFYYLGNNAVSLPSNLKHLMIRAQGCKTASSDDVERLDAYLTGEFGPGIHGSPNNQSRTPRRRCGCGRANNRLDRTGGKKDSGGVARSAAGRSAVRCPGISSQS